VESRHTLLLFLLWIPLKTQRHTPGTSRFCIGCRQSWAKGHGSKLGGGERRLNKKDVRKKCGALLGKGDCRLWTNMFVRERLSPFLKSRPADAFRASFFCDSFLPARLEQSTPCLFIPAFPNRCKTGVPRHVPACFFGNPKEKGECVLRFHSSPHHIGMLRSNMPIWCGLKRKYAEGGKEFSFAEKIE